jgi:hypothetical protein
VQWVVRLVGLVLVTALILVTTRDTRATVWVLLLAAAALPAWTQPYNGRLAFIGRLAEVFVVTFGASTLAIRNPGLTISALLPYLGIPFVVPALSGRLRESMLLLGCATAFLTGAAAWDGHLKDPAFVLPAVEWLALAGLTAGFVNALHRRYRRVRPATVPAYAEATRLLTQLRTVARRLPGATLDPGGIAENLIEEARSLVSCDRAAVLSGSGGGHLVVLAQSAGDRVDWETSLGAESSIAEAWTSQLPQIAGRSQARTGATQGEVSSLALPLVAGVRTVGVLVLELEGAGAFLPTAVSRLTTLAEPAALRLEAALLFDDVRSLATNEERQRLAREIHDGIAQELVIIG